MASKCGGSGRRVYANSGTYKPGVLNASVMTDDVCNGCWGSGDEANPSPPPADAPRRNHDAVVIIHITDESRIPTEYIVVGDDIRVFVVDENCPDDRVYEVANRSTIERIQHLIPGGSVIGSRHDERHKAIEARVNAFLDGRRMLAVVPKCEVSDA